MKKDRRNTIMWAENLFVTESINDLNLVVEENEVIAITGIGKEERNNLFKVFGCMKKPTKGRYIFDYEDIKMLESDKLEFIRREKIGYVFDSPNLFNDLNVIQNVTIWIDYVLPRKKSYDKGMKILEYMGMESKSNYRIAQLTYFEKILVSLSRALINNPLMLLIDDILSSLKPAEILELNKILLKISQNDITIIILSNNTSYLSTVDRIINLCEVGL